MTVVHLAYFLAFLSIGALACLFGSKVLNVQIPFLFKYAIDSLHVLPPLDSVDNTVITGSAAFVLGYGAARLGMLFVCLLYLFVCLFFCFFVFCFFVFLFGN